MRLNFGKKLKEIHQKLVGQGLKIAALLVLLIYWVTIIIATFLQ